MRTARLRLNFSCSAMVMLLAAPGTAALAANSAPIEPNYYAYYQPLKNNTQIQWQQCGVVSHKEFCASSGTFKGFKRACALIEGEPGSALDTTTGQLTVTRNVYVVDGGDAPSDPVVLRVFKRTDKSDGPVLFASSAPVKTVSLQLPSNFGVACSIAGNKDYLFIGTTMATRVLRVNKANYGQTLMGGMNPPVGIKSIRADANGFISVTYMGGSVAGFDIFAPDVAGGGDGGGAGFIVDTRNAHTIR